MTPLTIWCNNEFNGDQVAERDLLVNGIGAHRLLIFDPGAPEALKALHNAHVAFGTPDPRAVCESANMRWAQLNSAGYTSFDDPGIRETLSQRGTIVTNSSAVYAEPCAQHLLAMITCLARGLPIALEAQHGDRSWRQSLRPSLPL